MFDYLCEYNQINLAVLYELMIPTFSVSLIYFVCFFYTYLHINIPATIKIVAPMSIYDWDPFSLTTSIGF